MEAETKSNDALIEEVWDITRKTVLSELTGYAAEAAMVELANHWKVALSEGHPRTILSQDLRDTIFALNEVLEKITEELAPDKKSGEKDQIPNKPARQIFLDGKEIKAERIEVHYQGLLIPSEDTEDTEGSLQINLTQEGVIMDVYTTVPHEQGINSGTSSEMAQEIIERICEENN